MRKKFLLLSLAFASMMGASAATLSIKDITLQKGQEGKITVYVDNDKDFGWGDYSSLQISIPVPEGVEVGRIEDVNLGGLADEAGKDSELSIRKAEEEENFKETNYILLMVVNDQPFNKELNSDAIVEITIPIKISEAKEFPCGEFEMDIVDGLNYGEYSQLFSNGDGEQFDLAEEASLVNGTLTIIPKGGYWGRCYYPKCGEVPPSGSVLSREGIESLMRFGEGYKNTLVVFDDQIPESWYYGLDNVVVNGKVERIVLTNAEPYEYDGDAFVAEKVEFTYNFEVKATKDGGWNSLAIPFNGVPEVEPLTNTTRETGKFWAKEFIGAADFSALKFANLETPVFEANKSYILAFPGETYGANEYLGNSLLITAENVEVFSSNSELISRDGYSMRTSYNGEGMSKSYVLDPKSNRFVYKEGDVSVAPFTAYAIRDLDDGRPAPRSLAILDAEQGLTSVEAVAANAGMVVYANEGDIVINANESGVASVYNVNGQAVITDVKYNEGETRISGLGAGSYIVAGQVVVLK